MDSIVYTTFNSDPDPLLNCWKIRLGQPKGTVSRFIIIHVRIFARKKICTLSYVQSCLLSVLFFVGKGGGGATILTQYTGGIQSKYMGKLMGVKII